MLSELMMLALLMAPPAKAGGERVDAPGLGEMGGVREFHLAGKVSYIHACI